MINTYLKDVIIDDPIIIKPLVETDTPIAEITFGGQTTTIYGNTGTCSVDIKPLVETDTPIAEITINGQTTTIYGDCNSKVDKISSVYNLDDYTLGQYLSVITNDLGGDIVDNIKHK